MMTNTTDNNGILHSSVDGAEIAPTNGASPAVREMIHQQEVFSGQLRSFVARNLGLLSRLFPTELDRALQDDQLTRARTDCAMHQRVLEIACTMRVERCKAAAEAWIKTVRLGEQGSSLSYAALRVEEFQQMMEERHRVFGAHVRRRCEDIEQCTMQKLKEKEQASLNREIDEHVDWMEDQVRKFRATASETIGDYEKPLPK